MCGICGIIRFDEEAPEENEVKKMMHLQKHRGPDDEGVFFEDNIGLGFVRLSILDLSEAGHQPMLSNDKRFVIVFNGEIFNYIELRENLKKLGYVFHTNTDTEVLLAAFQEWGEKCLNRLNGMWAFLIYDRKERKIFASRDRYGIKPFYYFLSNHFFAFASEITPLLSVLKTKPTPDYQLIFDYLVFNRTDHTEGTFFREIKKMQHGHFLSLSTNNQSKGNEFKIKKWYDLRQIVSVTKGIENPGEFKNLFRSAIQLRLRSDVPVGVCLSGGLDSSSIVSVLVNDLEKKDLNTFSAVYGKGRKGDESEYIKLFEPVVKSMHYITPTPEIFLNELDEFISAQSEPLPTTSPYAQFKVMQLAKKNVVVTIDGQGADEQLAGYHYFYGFYFKDLLLKNFNLKRLTNEIYHYVKKQKSLLAFKTLIYFLLNERWRTQVSLKNKKFIKKGFVSSFKNENKISGSLYSAKSLNEALINHFEYKLEHLLKWADRNSMWHSLEARVPFLDYRLVEKVIASEGDILINNGNTKNILRQAMESSLPDKILNRHDKIGFATPQHEWFKTKEWQETIKGILMSPSFNDREIIDPNLASIQYERYLKGTHVNTKDIWKWINLELWFRKFID